MIYSLKHWLIKKQLKKREILALSPSDIERKHHNKTLPLFNDSSYFNGIDNKGAYFLSRMSFRNNRPNEHWLEFYDPRYGLLRRIPSPGEEKNEFHQGSLQFELKDPLKSWQVRFHGEMSGEEKVHQVEIDLTFKAITPLIDFQHALMLENTAQTIARAKWSKSFFNKLKEIRKMHFEQGGMLSGTITVDGNTQNYEFHSMRDHSWGTRNWADWKRHVWMCGMLENGDCINVSMIKYDFLGQLSAGFYTSGNTIKFLRSCPLFEEFAIDPLFPEKASMKLEFEDNLMINFEWQRQTFVPYVMDHGAYNIYEGISRGKANGVAINLVTEFGFNPKHYTLNE